ncbi:hypothetical protein CLOBL_54490 [Clostridium sp. BL-8]|nr:hypothetical protein CLOBL_54490 [Clostridium sp. BL-8]
MDVDLNYNNPDPVESRTQRAFVRDKDGRKQD